MDSQTLEETKAQVAEAKKKRRDEELVTMEKCDDLVSKLPWAQQQRVIHWLSSRAQERAPIHQNAAMTKLAHAISDAPVGLVGSRY